MGEKRDETVRGYVSELVTVVSTWPGVETGEHRYDGTEFTLGPREVGHVHRWGIVDIAYPKRLRDLLVASGRTGPHHIYPESGWTTFYLSTASDVADATWLLGLSYLWHLRSLSRTPAGSEVAASIDVDAELTALDLDPELSAVFETERVRAEGRESASEPS